MCARTSKTQIHVRTQACIHAQHTNTRKMLLRWGKPREESPDICALHTGRYTLCHYSLTHICVYTRTRVQRPLTFARYAYLYTYINILLFLYPCRDLHPSPYAYRYFVSIIDLGRSCENTQLYFEEENSTFRSYPEGFLMCARRRDTFINNIEDQSHHQ